MIARLPNPYIVLLDSPKTVPGNVTWVGPDGDGVLSFLHPLNVQGYTMEGLFFRGRTYVQCPDRAVMFQLEIAVDNQRTRLPVTRLDWRPLTRHSNKGIGPAHLRWRHMDTHIHTLELNWLPDKGTMRAGNLPIAEPIDPDLNDYYSVLDFSGNAFRINNMGIVPVPPWAPTLL